MAYNTFSTICKIQIMLLFIFQNRHFFFNVIIQTNAILPPHSLLVTTPIKRIKFYSLTLEICLVAFYCVSAPQDLYPFVNVYHHNNIYNNDDYNDDDGDDYCILGGLATSNEVIRFKYIFRIACPFCGFPLSFGCHHTTPRRNNADGPREGVMVKFANICGVLYKCTQYLIPTND